MAAAVHGGFDVGENTTSISSDENVFKIKLITEL